jgi:hypothetical protein
MNATKKTCAVILGYGIPRDILTDGNYRKYLQEAHAVINRNSITDIVFCGGHTNCHHPEKSEAAEMQRLFEKIHADHFVMLQKATNEIPEFSVEQVLFMRHELEKIQADFLNTPHHYTLLDTSITSFDNITGLGVYMLVKNFDQAIVFCEQSRRFKIKLLCKKLIQKGMTTNIIGINFDASRTWSKDTKQLADYFLTWGQLFFPTIGHWRNARQRRHIERVSQK